MKTSTLVLWDLTGQTYRFNNVENFEIVIDHVAFGCDQEIKSYAFTYFGEGSQEWRKAQFNGTSFIGYSITDTSKVYKKEV